MMHVSFHEICLLLLIAFQLVTCTYCGHEVLYDTIFDTSDLKAGELMIAQYDSRLPLPLQPESYWGASARWNTAYAVKHGHRYQYLSSRNPLCEIDGMPLASPWCKVKAMVALDSMLLPPEVKGVLFLDSDAVMSVNYSLATVLSFIRKERSWDMKRHPVAFNQDGPGWSCKFTIKQGYTRCLNSGTVFWLRSAVATNILQQWWRFAAKPYSGTTRFPSKWKLKWPWEQAPQHEIHRMYNDSIMLLSFPEKPFLPWTSLKNPKAQYPSDTVEPWCFSHWPGANCFITHHAASKNQKLKLIENYKTTVNVPDIKVVYID